MYVSLSLEPCALQCAWLPLAKKLEEEEHMATELVSCPAQVSKPALVPPTWWSLAALVSLNKDI